MPTWTAVPKHQNVTGLELEPSAVHAVGVSVNGTVSVKHAALAPLEPGVVRDGEVQDAAALTEALRQMFKEHKDLDKRVRVGIANAKIVVRVITLPPISDPKQLAQAVRFQAQDEIPMPLDQAVLDFQVLDIVDTPEGPRQRVALVAARKDMVSRIVGAVRDAGLKPEGIDLSAFAMVRALHRGAHPDETIVYLAVGGLTNLALAQGTTCEFTRVLGGGLESMAVELAERKAITLEQARAHIEHPVADSTDPIALEANDIVFDGVRTIAREVRSSIEFHHQTGLEAPVARCVLTGPAASIPGFAEQLTNELGFPVELGLVEAPAGIDAGRLTVAAGLAIEEAAA